MVLEGVQSGDRLFQDAGEREFSQYHYVNTARQGDRTGRGSKGEEGEEKKQLKKGVEHKMGTLSQVQAWSERGEGNSLKKGGGRGGIFSQDTFTVNNSGTYVSLVIWYMQTPRNHTWK